MLKIYDENHNAVGQLWEIQDLAITSELDTGDKTMTFTYLSRSQTLKEEYYIQDKENEYVVKQVERSTDGSQNVTATLNLEDLEGIPWQKFAVKNSTIEEAARLAIAGTGWRVGECNVTKRRNAAALNTTALGVIDKLCTAFICERVYDTINKTVSFYEAVGEDKGVYFLRSLNLRKLSAKSDSYDFYTSIYPVGKDGLTIESVNNGSKYLENYSYSRKKKTYLWADDSYDDPQALLEDAELKLEDLAKPASSYSAEIWDLAKCKPGYTILSFSLGDTITLIDKELGIREKQRIKKLVEYPQDPSKNTCELGNTFLTFVEMQQKVKDATAVIETAIDSEGNATGTITTDQILGFSDAVSKNDTMQEVVKGNLEISGELTVLKEKVGTIDATYIKATEAEIKYATIENLNVTNQKIQTIEGNYAKFRTTVTDEIIATNGQIENLSGDFVSFKTGEFESLKGDFVSFKTGDFETLKGDFTSFKAGEFESLKAKQANFEETTTGRLSAQTADISDLKVKNQEVENQIVKKADIDLANVTNAWIDKGIIKEGAIGGAAIHDGAITNAKIADATIEAAKINSVNADVINAGTIRTERLIITGPDGEDSIVKAINMANGITEAEVNSQKIQAASIDVVDLSAFNATLAQFRVSGNAIYSGKKSIRDPTSGIYVSTTGIGVGDGKLTDTDESPVQVYADGTLSLKGKNGSLKFDPVTGNLDIKATSMEISSKTPVTKDDLDEIREEISTLLRLESSRGTVFKNDQVSTVLSVVIYHGKQRITDAETMHSVFGAGAYLQWKWQRLGDEDYGIISASDSRFGNEGFTFTLSPDDVNTKITFMCELIV